MPETRLSFSIIIPKRFHTKHLIQSTEAFSYPSEKLELILVEGTHPALQRNEGARVAKGDILCFWDDDCRPCEDYFQKVAQLFEQDEKVTAVGGPAVPVVENGFLKNLYALALQSYFVHYKMRARYLPVGNTRETDEKELIGCNLCVKRKEFLELGGFKPELYPNEENEFLNRLKRKSEYKIIYSPDVVVYREMRDSFPFFIKRFYRYGGGRAKQVLFDSLKDNILFFLPLFLLLYLFILVFVRNNFYYFPLLVYFCCGVVFSLRVVFKFKNIWIIFILPVISFLIHLSYAIGFIWGVIKYLIFKKEKKSLADVGIKIEKINPL
jgi:cellulose synthase/poly-beta-1,6-N-acetylglucosamine synthase-like glycosyltransferase